jgi:hypothetical protein
MPCKGLNVVLLSETSADARWKPKKVANNEEARVRFMFLEARSLCGIYMFQGE